MAYRTACHCLTWLSSAECHSHKGALLFSTYSCHLKGISGVGQQSASVVLEADFVTYGNQFLLIDILTLFEKILLLRFCSFSLC
jgi:hypothetical protein